ncbi:acetyl-coenzyme A transporter-like protein [Dinothrombium tinctorium]|nr:acetyl-coenzyme A transporter-like protein [Dinothrombium tinctorium]
MVNKGVTYDKQAVFSIAHWPYSMKLLWAPIVDSIYSKRFGRRKSWFVPVQYGIALCLLLIALSSKYLLGNNDDPDKTPPKVIALTIAFFILVFLSATQDVAVDGWALTLLSKRNVQYAPSSNAVGITLGSIFGGTLFLALESADFCNSWLRTTKSDTGIVTFESYLLFWSIICFMVTTLVWIFKHETDAVEESGEVELGIVKTYKMLWNILCLPTLRYFALILLTINIATAAADSVTKLKLVEYGLKRENIGLMDLPILPLQLVLPWLVTKFGTKQPLKSSYYLYPFRLVIILVKPLMVWWTIIEYKNGSFSYAYYTGIICCLAISMVSRYCVGMTVWAFMAQVSDPLIGGTYMTLLTTISNLGMSWASTVSLYFVKVLTFYWCPNNGYFCSKDMKIDLSTSNRTLLSDITKPYLNVNESISSEEMIIPSEISAFNQSIFNETMNSDIVSASSNSNEFILIDGYYVEIFISVILGIIWMILIRSTVMWLQSEPKSSWRTSKKVPV